MNTEHPTDTSSLKFSINAHTKHCVRFNLGTTGENLVPIGVRYKKKNIVNRLHESLPKPTVQIKAQSKDIPPDPTEPTPKCITQARKSKDAQHWKREFYAELQTA